MEEGVSEARAFKRKDKNSCAIRGSDASGGENCETLCQNLFALSAMETAHSALGERFVYKPWY